MALQYGPTTGYAAPEQCRAPKRPNIVVRLIEPIPVRPIQWRLEQAAQEQAAQRRATQEQATQEQATQRRASQRRATQMRVQEQTRLAQERERLAQVTARRREERRLAFLQYRAIEHARLLAEEAPEPAEAMAQAFAQAEIENTAQEFGEPANRACTSRVVPECAKSLF